MINPSMFADRVKDKMKTLALEALVNQIFVKALPFEVSKLGKRSQSEINKYAIATMEAMGGYAVLENAIQQEKDPIKLVLLKDIDRICTEAAQNVAAREVKDRVDALRDHQSSMEELIGDSGFTEKELKDFQKNAEKIDVDRLSEIIKKKVIDVLKEEKESHERIEKVNSELRDAADDVKANNTPEDETTDVAQDNDSSEDEEDKPENNSEDLTDDKDSKSEDDDDEQPADTSETEDDESEEQQKDKKDDVVESFIDLVLGGRKNEHRSLFNTIQTAACEQIIVTEDTSALNPNRISSRRLKNITFENTLDLFQRREITLGEAIENLTAIRSAETQEKFSQHRIKVINAATIDSIIVYTMLESLNTINLIHPSQKDIQQAIESYSSMNAIAHKTASELNNLINQDVCKAHRAASAHNYAAVESYIEQFEKVQQFANSSFENAVSEPTMENVVNCMGDLLKAKKAMETPWQATTESYAEHLENARNASQMLRVKGLMRSVMNPSSILFEQYPNDPNLTVTVKSPSRDVQTHITFENYTGSIDQFRRILGESVLMESSIPEIYLSIKDGKGTKIKVK